MSLDLLKEFGLSSQDISRNLWRSDPTQSSKDAGSTKGKNLNDDDDFGDFEVPNEQNFPPSPGFSTQKSLKTERMHLSGKGGSQGVEVSLETSNFSTLEDDEWGDFIDDSNKSSGSLECIECSGMKSPLDILHLDPLQVHQTPSRAPSSKLSEEINIHYQNPPPYNVPPPSILLSLVTSLFQRLPADIKNIVPSQASLIDQTSINKFLTCIIFVRAAARIIAGRKLRWKRDKNLSQNMKIGPAHAGRAGGMKLTGVDKSEIHRENREVEEAIGTWKEQLGRIRAITATINHRQAGINLTVPEILEIMPVRQASTVEGAISAPTCCFLCGTKRDERVEKIDAKVEDSFGEWWIDHWGHVDCATFWREQESCLQQR